MKQDFLNELLDPEFPADKLPDPDSSLNKKLPTAVIVKANEAFVATIKDSTKPGGSYAHYNPTQRFEMGKRAAEYSIAATIRYYKKRFLELALKETTIRHIKNLYLTEIKKRPVNELNAFELPPSKRGRPLLIGETLDKQVREYWQELRDRGGVINTAIAIGCGTRIVISQDPTLLASNGGGVTLTKDWAK